MGVQVDRQGDFSVRDNVQMAAVYMVRRRVGELGANSC